MKKLGLTIMVLVAILLANLCVYAQTATPPHKSNDQKLPQSQKIPKQKVVDQKFKLVTTALFVSTIYDIETTFTGKKRCSTCYEANPIARPFVKSGRPAMYGFAFAVNGLATYSAYEMKKHHKKYWWLVPVIATTTHCVAGSLNLRFVF